jgi:exosortase A
MRSGRTSCATSDDGEDAPRACAEDEVSAGQAVSRGIAVETWPSPGGRKSRWAIATGLVAACVVALVAAYWPTARDMVETWMISSTYAHGFLIAPISAWLIWSRREALAPLPVRVDPRALPFFAVTGAFWLLGQLAGVAAIQQFALVASIVLLVWALLGEHVVRALAFPLAFLLLAVPFGDFLLPYLMEVLADVLVHALRATGIPVYREGLDFVTPSGNWSIVEGCAGLRFLMACMTGGLLYAYLRYRSLPRRVLFVVAAVVVPVVANWTRAYLVVVLDTFAGGRYSVTSDHITYGWLFFGAVTLLLLWAGSLWREDDAPLAVAAMPSGHVPASRAGALVGVAVTAAALIVVWPLLASAIEGAAGDRTPLLNVSPHPGTWQAFAGPVTSWSPHFMPPAAEVNHAYADGARRAGLHVGYYMDQRRGSKLVSSLNLLVSGDDEWRIQHSDDIAPVIGKAHVAFKEYRLQGRRERVLVWQTYWVDGLYTANPYWAKVLQIRSQLLRQRDDGAVVLLFMPYDDASKPPVDALRDFAEAVLPGVTRSLYDAR